MEMARAGGGTGNIDKEKLKQQAVDHWKNKVAKIDEYDARVWDILSDVPKVK